MERNDASEDERGAKPAPRIPLLEWIASGIGLLLALLVFGVIAWQALKEFRPVWRLGRRFKDWRWNRSRPLVSIGGFRAPFPGGSLPHIGDEFRSWRPSVERRPLLIWRLEHHRTSSGPSVATSDRSCISHAIAATTDRHVIESPSRWPFAVLAEGHGWRISCQRWPAAPPSL